MFDFLYKFLPEDTANFIINTISQLIESLINYWYLFVGMLIFLYLVRRYTDRDMFGLRIITGMFGDGKTYNNSLETKKYAELGYFIISNVRNSFTNLTYDSVLDLERIFAYMMEYARITNNQEFIENGFRPVVFNIDESHNYFFSRGFADNINKDNLMVATQVRKRNILATFITQELAQLDIFFRRLSGGIVMRYYTGFGFIRFWRLYYVPNPETTNLQSEEEGVEIIKRGIYLAPTFLTKFSRHRKEMISEKYVSKIIVGYEDLLNDYSFMDFLKDLYPLEAEYGKEFWKIYKIKYGDLEFKTEFENKEFLVAEKKRIKERLEEIKLENDKLKIKKFDLENNKR